MADEKVTWPSSTPTAVSDYQAQNTLLSKIIIGLMELSLTNYNNTSLPAIAAGSIIEVAGSLYQFASETAISGSASAGMNYIYMVPSGSDLTPTWTTTAPTWDAAKQGWYGTGGAATYRYVASVYLSGANYVGKTMLERPVVPKPGAATFIIASTDSSDRSQATADWVCDKTADEVEINAAIAYLNGLGGGELVIMEGTYNIAAAVTPLSNVNIRGCQAILKKSTGLNPGVDIDTQSNITLFDLVLDGNSQTGNGIEESGSTNIKYVRCETYGNGSNGFLTCNNLDNCISHDNTYDGFSDCVRLVGCYSYGNGHYGYEDCIDLTVCEAYDNDSIGFDGGNGYSACHASYNGSVGFNSCYSLAACKADNNTESGFSSCRLVSGCESKENTTTGYYSCDHMVGCGAEENGTDGFYTCDRLTGCYAYNNTGDGYDGCKQVVASWAYSNGAYGFTGCIRIGHNLSGANTSGNYHTSYADGSSTQAAADTAVGGYNT